MWKERCRLESELDARRQEVDRLRTSEEAARAAAAVLDGKVEDMSAALREEKARAKREAEAAVAAEARDAMEALRRQLDDLRKEVDRTKPGQLGGGGGVRGRGPNPDGAASGFSVADDAGPPPRGVRRKGESPATGAGGLASPCSPPSLAVLEAEFQRLRAKYEKAKGRIVALEELVAASRRVSAQARREFQVCTSVCDEYGYICARRKALVRENAGVVVFIGVPSFSRNVRISYANDECTGKLKHLLRRCARAEYA